MSSQKAYGKHSTHQLCSSEADAAGWRVPVPRQLGRRGLLGHPLFRLPARHQASHPFVRALSQVLRRAANLPTCTGHPVCISLVHSGQCIEGLRSCTGQGQWMLAGVGLLADT